METNNSASINQSSKLIFTNRVGEALDALVDSFGSPNVYILVDTNTQSFVLPSLQAQSQAAANARVILTKAGDINKNLDALTALWKQLSDQGASRDSVLVNLGGGVVTDLGGLAASTFKRGMHFINIPTTLLGAVDAAIGGKTAVNFNGLKNQIGTFADADAAIISTGFFNTLPQQELLSGYAEMIKHALLETTEFFDRLLGYSVVYPEFNADQLLQLLEESARVKERIVAGDKTDRDVRRSLNLGHTVAHAIEAMAMNDQSPVPHGYAVAWGLVVAVVLSHMQFDFPSDELHKLAQYVRRNYGGHDIPCDRYDTLIDLMRQDKKNSDNGQINFTLLRAIGDPVINCTATPDQIKAALDIYRDLVL